MCTLAGGAAMPQLCLHVHRDSGVQGECKLSKGVSLSACDTLLTSCVSSKGSSIAGGALNSQVMLEWL